MTITEDRAAMSAASINDLPDSAFAHIEPGGSKDSEGKTTPRSLRHYPVHDAAHARDALGRAQAQINGGDADAKRIAHAAMPKIRAAARKFGIEVGDGGHAARTPLETLRRRRGSMIRQAERRGAVLELRAKPDGTGGTTFVFEGYGSVFDAEFDMWDRWGDPYTEVVRKGAFAQSLARPDLDVPFLIGHDDSRLALARTRNGTMQLSEDSHGLLVRAVMDGRRSDVRDLAYAVERGDMDEMSIGFVTEQQQWSDDFMTREMLGLNLHRGDVSSVPLAASPSTAGATMFAMPGESWSAPWQPGGQRLAASHPPFTGTHSHAHPAYGDGGQHDHEHDHQGDANHDHHPAPTTDDPDSDGLAPTLDQASARRPAEQLARGQIADSDSRPDFNVDGAPPYNAAAHGASSLACPHDDCPVYAGGDGQRALNAQDARYCDQCGGPLYDGDGLMVLDDAGVVEEVAGAQGDANLLSLRLRLLELA